MIRNILDLLEIVEDGSENIRIARGKYNLPLSIKESYKQKLKENKWKE